LYEWRVDLRRRRGGEQPSVSKPRAGGGATVADAEVVLAGRAIVSLGPIALPRTDAEGAFRFVGPPPSRADRDKDGVGASGRAEVRLYFGDQNRCLEDVLKLED